LTGSPYPVCQSDFIPYPLGQQCSALTDAIPGLAHPGDFPSFHPLSGNRSGLPLPQTQGNMPSADFSHAVKVDHSTLSQFQSHATPQGTWEISRGKTQNLPCISARFIKHTPRMENFAVTCQLVPGVPHLLSDSCSSPRMFGLGFLQTASRDDALALLLAFGSANTWREDLHLTSSVPCPAHTTEISGGFKPSARMNGYAIRFFQYPGLRLPWAIATTSSLPATSRYTK
jgi:hypothetical protein